MRPSRLEWNAGEPMLRFPLFVVAEDTHAVAALCDCTDDGTPTLRLANGTVCTSLRETGGPTTWHGWRVCVVDDAGDRRWLRMTELRVPLCNPVPSHCVPSCVTSTCTRQTQKKKKKQTKRSRDAAALTSLERRRVDALRARMATTPRGKWTSDFVMDLLREPLAPPRLLAVVFDDDTDELSVLPFKKRLPFVRCTFAIDDDDDVTVRLPLTALVHVPNYADLVEPLLLMSSKRTTDGSW